METFEASVDSIEVHAHTITKMQFYYTCPFCWTRYKKNGEPSLKGYPGTHWHGSGGNLTNQRTHRVSHCTKSTEKTGSVFITIDDSTIRRETYKIVK
jgi:hypothetical protein